MLRETSPLLDKRDVASSQLKRSVYLTKRERRVKVEPDSSVSWMHSSTLGRLIFGRGSIEVFKVQAGLKVPIRLREWRVRIAPAEVGFTSQAQDQVQVSQSIRVTGGQSEGYSRKLSVTNRTETNMRVRVLSTHDPTSINFGREKDPPGEIGVNAFNRGDHVVMDDVGDSAGVRVIGFSTRPTSLYMTKDRQRAGELLSSGELPESTAGISGAIIVLSQHDTEVPPGATADLTIASLYHPSSLEAVLSSLAPALNHQSKDEPKGTVFRCSNPSVSFAFSWAKAALDSTGACGDACDELASGFALGLLGDPQLDVLMESTRSRQRKDGLVPHSGDASRGGILETALFLHCAGTLLRMKSDKKLARKWYPALKRGAEGLISSSHDGLIFSGGPTPEGWRRRLGSGFPTGYVSEVNVTAARGLEDAAAIAYLLGKGSDSARFKDHSLRIVSSTSERLRDPETGNLALNLDQKGRLHKEVTVDLAVGLSYFQFDHNLSSSAVHRLLEKDFETGYGPRTVPTSNALYYNSSYGQGQMGGYWTRAALAHALLAYLSGYPSIGSLQVEKVARLVHTDAERLGGVPGEFPYWMDPDKKLISSSGSDPVAAARFVESLVMGEMGLSVGPQRVRLSVPGSSQLKWFSFHGIMVGEVGSVFVGRASGRVFAATTFREVELPDAQRFHDCERVELEEGLDCMMFWNSVSILLCLGNASSSQFVGAVPVPVKGKALERSLFADLEEFDQEASAWHRLERIKLGEKPKLRVDLRPSSWRALRLVQTTS